RMDSDDVQDKKTNKTEVPVTSSSRSSDLASKFLIFSYIPPADAEIISPLDVHVLYEVPRIHTSTLLAVPVLVILEASHVYTNIPKSSQTFTSLPLQSTPTPLLTNETINIPPSILDFTSVFRFNDRVIALEKDVVELKNDPLHAQVIALVDDHLDTRMRATREEFMNNVAEMTRIKMKANKDAKPTISLETKDSSSRSFKGTKSQPKSSRKSVHANNQSSRLKILIRLKVKKGVRYLQGGVLTMTYTTSTTKTKAAQYDLAGIEDMCKSFYAYARGIQSRGDVYSTKRILAVTHVSVMKKHGYGYLEEIVVRRADNKLYKFKVGDDVADFEIAVRMFTRSLAFFFAQRHYQEIDMEYLPKRRCSTLEKKRAHYMIKDIYKLLKERMMMRSLEKFVGGRLYETNLRLLQRTI
nr:hypothetical protein [Tanacetum cinerariifolium]